MTMTNELCWVSYEGNAPRIAIGKTATVTISVPCDLRSVEELKGFKYDIIQSHRIEEPVVMMEYTLMITGTHARSNISFNKSLESTTRQLEVEMEVVGDNAEVIFEILSERLEDALKYLDARFSHYTTNEGNTFADVFFIEYTHGEMTAIKNDIMKQFKAIKKELGIK